MMSETNNTNANAVDEIVREILKGKPLSELRQRGLDVNKIFRRIKISGVRKRLIDDGTNQLKRFEQRKQLVLKVLDKMNAEIKNLCTHQPNANRAIKTMANDSRNSLPSASAEDKIFLIYLEELCCQFKAILHDSTAKKTRRQETTEFFKSTTAKIEKEMDRLTNILKQKQLSFQEKIKPKQQVIQNLKTDMTRMKTIVDYKISNIIHEARISVSEKTQIKSAVIEEVHRSLKTTETEIEKYQLDLSIDVRKLKEQKLKAEQTLQTLYLKFDNDVGGRGGKLDAIQKETKVEQKDFDVWKETVVEPQLIAYNMLMLQKEEEERQEDELLVQELLQNHAARIIQKSWRKYLKRKKKKEGKDKGKGKRKIR